MSNRLAWVIALLCAGPACAPGSDDAWQLKTPRPFLAGDSEAFTPAIDSGSIFFCGGYPYTAAAELVAVNATDGIPRWRLPMESCGASPIVIDSAIVVAFGREAHTPRAVLYGVDASTGIQKWRRAVGALTAHANRGRFVYLALADGSLQRVDGTNGQVAPVALQRESADRWWLAATDRGLIVGAGESLWDIADVESEAVLGPRLQSSVRNVVAARSEGNLLVLQDKNNGLAAFEPSSGRLLWTRRWPRLLSEPTISNGRVFINAFGPNRYELQAMDGATGRALWIVTDGSFEAPTASNGLLYAAGRSSVLIINPETGVVVGGVKGSTEIISSPLPLGELVLFGTIDGVLHAASGS